MQNKNSQAIELPSIYDSLVSQIPEDAKEKLLLADMLKKKGFKVINWGRGNYHPRGARIVSITLQKNDCICEVNKMYYSTASDTLFEVVERIRCVDSLTYAKKTVTN